jgi:hypothetical protein
MLYNISGVDSKSGPFLPALTLFSDERNMVVKPQKAM